MKLDNESELSESTTPPGKLDWSPILGRDYDKNEKWFDNHAWDYDMAGKVSVKTIYDFITSRRLDEYNFIKTDGEFAGCRHWV